MALHLIFYYIRGMKKSIEDKINELIAKAKASNIPSTRSGRVSGEQDSLSKAITNKKDADMFLAELELAIKMAHEQQ